jgi:hypothetical protein
MTGKDTVEIAFAVDTSPHSQNPGQWTLNCAYIRGRAVAMKYESYVHTVHYIYNNTSTQINSLRKKNSRKDTTIQLHSSLCPLDEKLSSLFTSVIQKHVRTSSVCWNIILQELEFGENRTVVSWSGKRRRF